MGEGVDLFNLFGGGLFFCCTDLIQTQFIKPKKYIFFNKTSMIFFIMCEELLITAYVFKDNNNL